MRAWATFGAFMVWGFGLFGRNFAYVGIPSAKIFIGDVALALFILFCNREVIGRWINGLIAPSPYGGFCWALLFSLFYSLLEAVRGFVLEYSPLTVLQTLVFSIYPIYFFVGLLVGRTYPTTLERFLRTSIWINCIMGLLYYTFQKQADHFTFPGTDTPIIGAPSGGIAFIALTYLGKDLKKWYFPLGVCLFLTLALQIRSDWVALSAAFTLQSLLIRKFRRVLVGAAAVATLLALGFVTDFNIPAAAGRGGTISSRELIGRALSSFDQEKAAEYSSNAGIYAGTVHWRENWWKAIWASVHSTKETAFFGHGYGFPLKDLVSYLHNIILRSPHNIFFYILGYTGWVGVVLFAFLQAMLAVVLYRTWRATGQPFGLVFWLDIMIVSQFGLFLDTPSGAIPYYLIMGMVVATLCPVAQPAQVTQMAVAPLAAPDFQGAAARFSRSSS